MKLAYGFAESNQIDHTFNKTTKMAGKNWVSGFCKRNNFCLRRPEKCSMGRDAGFNRVQCTRFFDNLKAVMEEKKFAAHRKFNMDESELSTVPNQIPKVISAKVQWPK